MQPNFSNNPFPAGTPDFLNFEKQRAEELSRLQQQFQAADPASKAAADAELKRFSAQYTTTEQAEKEAQQQLADEQANNLALAGAAGQYSQQDRSAVGTAIDNVADQSLGMAEANRMLRASVLSSAPVVPGAAVAAAAPITAPTAAPAASPAKKDAKKEVQDPYGKGHIGVERYFDRKRAAVVLTCSAWQQAGKFIELWVNPLNAAWSIGRRETSSKTAAGVVRNTWRNRYRDTYYDEYTVAFTFQTGSLMPSAAVSERMTQDPLILASIREKPPVPPGLVDFYKFLELVDQPMLLGQRENRHHVYYKSRVFPDIHLEGYFVGETPIAFTENAEGNANQLQWTSTFQVYKSNPPINQYRRLIASWEASFRGSLEVSPSFEGLPPLPPKTAGAKPTATGKPTTAQLLNTSRGAKKAGLAVSSFIK
jgi:hypothetical protein